MGVGSFDLLGIPVRTWVARVSSALFHHTCSVTGCKQKEMSHGQLNGTCNIRESQKIVILNIIPVQIREKLFRPKEENSNTSVGSINSMLWKKNSF